MRRKIPAGKFEPLWGKEQLRAPPPLPEKHSYKDVLAYRQMEDTIQRRKDLNRQTVEARNACDMYAPGTIWVPDACTQ